AEKIRQDAKADLEAQKAKAMSDLSQEVGNMALAMASKILGTELKDPAVRSSMADLAVNKIGSEGGKQS
ncbi:MAG: F0F1 ATP synthase subunit B, partial [Aeriscardovia sp.]|nr:F0F1 ATP synthase subunit B [Aeriscardovia sp.]